MEQFTNWFNRPFEMIEDNDDEAETSGSASRDSAYGNSEVSSDTATKESLSDGKQISECKIESEEIIFREKPMKKKKINSAFRSRKILKPVLSVLSDEERCD